MYLIEWVENGKNKSFCAEGYIERLVMEEKLEEKNIAFSTETL